MSLPVITSSAGASSTGSVASLTMSHVSDGNPLLVIAARFEQISGQGSCTFNGVTMAPAGRFVPANLTTGSIGTYTFEFYVLMAPDSATANVIYTPAASDFIAVGAYSIENWSGGFRFQSGSAAGTAVSTSLTGISATDELMIDFVVSDAQAAQATIGASQTQLFNVVGDNDLASSSKASAESSVSMAWTLATSDTWSHAVLALVGTSDSNGGNGGGGISAMPGNTLLVGPPNSIVQTTTYALPARAVRVFSSLAVEISYDGSTWDALTSAETVGADCAGGFIRCTGGAATVFCKAY